MSEVIKRALRNLVNPTDGFDPQVLLATVLSVDKNAVTCSVQTVSDDIEIDDVKLKPVENNGDLTQMGLIIYPAVGSFVLIGQVEDDNSDIFVVSCTVIESISLDTATPLNLLISSDGKLNLNAVQITFNKGNNGGVPLVNPLTSVIMKLQQQVNTLITTFNTHIHPATSGTTSPTVTPGPPITTPLIKTTDIANKIITQ